jgi:hypothetical protein
VGSVSANFWIGTGSALFRVVDAAAA